MQRAGDIDAADGDQRDAGPGYARRQRAEEQVAVDDRGDDLEIGKRRQRGCVGVGEGVDQQGLVDRAGQDQQRFANGPARDIQFTIVLSVLYLSRTHPKGVKPGCALKREEPPRGRDNKASSPLLQQNRPFQHVFRFV